MERGITERFRVLAQAHLIQPLPRADAQLIVSHVADVAAAFNRHAA